MKPFNLEAFKQGAVGITRCGDEVSFVAYVPEAKEFYRLVYMDRKGYIESCSEEGKYLQAGEGEMDIIGLKTETKTYWINIYEDSCYGYDTKERADQTMSIKRINGKAYKVEIEL